MAATKTVPPPTTTGSDAFKGTSKRERILRAAIDVFALASARLYDEIARDDPQPFKQRLASVADAWVRHRHAWPCS